MGKTNLTKIAIVGLPNVGKSSLFNRIVGSRKAIVESASGTTRDRLYADIGWKGKAFTIIDTGGFDAAKRSDMASLVLRQLERAIEEADIIFFVTDGSRGISPQDREFSSLLRKASKKIYLIVNKCDGKSDADNALEFFELGLGEPYAVSAAHGLGIERLIDHAAKTIGRPVDIAKEAAVKVAIVGRPNVGKSSYLNAVLMEDRAIVHEIPGTTRDAVDTDFKYKDRDYLLIDTAGIRHNPKLNEPADFYSGVRSKEAIKRCDTAAAIIDGMDGMREDDERIIELVINEGKGLVIAVNKWDLAEGAETAIYSGMLVKKMNLIRNYPVIFMSCKTKRNVMSVLDEIWSVHERSKKIFGAGELAKMLEYLNGSPEIRNRRIKFESVSQKGTVPQEFVLRVKKIKMVNENLKRYIENFLRSTHDFRGLPIKLSFTRC